MHARSINCAAVAAAAIVSLAAVGCGGGSATDKAGGSGASVTLRVATPDRAGMAGAKAIEHFRDEVAKLSDGAIRITPMYQAGGQAPSFDQAVAELVRTGRVELALVPARAWDEYGVTGLSALHAPFLIRDQAVLDEVVTGELAEPMMQGLRRTGVTGLALLPGSLRHPFAFTGALRSPRDFAGAGIWAPRSQTSYALLRALGAEPIDIGDITEFKQAVKDGRVAGAESAFELAAATLPGVPTATGNVTFFPRVDILVANSSALGKLSKSTRTALETAAANTQDWVRRTKKDERDAALDYCRQGGRVIAAGAGDIERLVAMAEPVYTALERDATTKQLIERIRRLAQDQGTAADQPVTCEPARTATPSDERGTASDTDPSVLDGVYRNRTTVEDFVAAGVPEADAIDNHGVHTITLDGGRLQDTLTTASTPNPGDGLCEGSYKLSDHTFIFTWDPATDCTGDFTATWQLSGGELRLTNIRTEERLDEVYWGVRPFRKIG
jgi:TRAP-type C4-dicarboxylate transport system substrate-binding protein